MFCLENASLELHGSEFVANRADALKRLQNSLGGAIFAAIASASTVKLVECLVRLDATRVADEDWMHVATEAAGGGIYVSSSFLALINCTIDKNSVWPIRGRGGAIFVKDSAPEDGGGLDVRGSRLLQNYARKGGALFVEASYFRIVETAFEDNVAWKQAGAIFAGLNPSYVSLSLRSALSKNRAAADMSTECRRFAPTHVAGGPSPAELVLSESTLAENTALVPVKNEPTGGYGGAIFVARNVELTVQGCRATSNTVEGDAGTKGQTMAGGFTSTCSAARVTLSDSHFVANQARLSTGTVRAVDSASISSCEITSAFGGAVYVVAQGPPGRCWCGAVILSCRRIHAPENRTKQFRAKLRRARPSRTQEIQSCRWRDPF